MNRDTLSDLDRKLDRIEQEHADAPAVRDLWIRSIRRAQGDVENPLPEDEFNDLWNQAMQEYGSPWDS